MIKKKAVKLININLIVDYFIWKGQSDKKNVTNKKLQKLLYYAQAWHLVFKGKPLFKDKIEAWVHGPTVGIIYDQFKLFSFNNIEKDINPDDLKKIPKSVLDILDEVWRVYGKYDGDYLELLTHNETPWQEARGNLETFEPSGNEVLLKTIKSFYTKRLKDSLKKVSEKKSNKNK